MKTAMQELYEDLEKFKGITDTISITDIQRMIGNVLLDKEKDQITNAYDAGNNFEGDWEAEETYYKETYK